jgi:hypothetical protein
MGAQPNGGQGFYDNSSQKHDDGGGGGVKGKHSGRGV